MSLEIFNNRESLYSINSDVIKLLKYDKSKKSLLIENCGISCLSKTTYLPYADDEYIIVYNRLKEIAENHSSFVFIESDESLMCLKKYDILSVSTVFDNIHITTYEYEYIEKISGIDEHGLYLAQLYAIQLIEKINE